MCDYSKVMTEGSIRLVLLNRQRYFYREAKKICDDKGVDVYNIVKASSQSLSKRYAEATSSAVQWLSNADRQTLPTSLQHRPRLTVVLYPGSVADDCRGIGHGNLAAMLLREETKCFAFWSWSRIVCCCLRCYCIAKWPTVFVLSRCALSERFGRCRAIIARINGFTYVETDFDYFTGETERSTTHCLLLATVQSKLLTRVQLCSRRCRHLPQRRCSTYRSPVTQPTQHVSSTLLEVPKRMYRAR